LNREKRASIIEAVALGLTGAVPMLPYLVRLIRTPAARFILEGDYSGLELATRFAFSGRTLLGPYSRFGFRHPGPAYFFFLAPTHALFGDQSRGLYAGALVINMLAAFAIGFTMRLLTTRVHAVAAVLVTIAWIAAFGNVAPLPWNPLVVVLPLLAFLVLASLFAAGHASVAPFAVVLGTFVGETHLSTIPTVVAVTLGTTVAFVVGRRRTRKPTTRRDRRFLLFAVAAFALMVAPMIVEQVTAPEGNLTKVVHFFIHRPEPLKPFPTAWNAFVSGTSWLPDRLLHSRMLDEQYPAPMASEPVETMSAGASVVPTVVMFVAVVLALVVAKRRRDGTSVAVVGTGLGASIFAILAMRGVVHITYQYLVFWTTAASTLAWMGVVATFASAARASWRSSVVGLVLAMLFTTSLAARWCERWPIALDHPRHDMQTLYGALRGELDKRHATAVLHIDGAWFMAPVLANELTRERIDARTDDRDRWLLGGQLRTPADVSGPVVHVYAHIDASPLKVRECTELLAAIDGIELRVAPTDVRDCPTP
jgi:hypothetical protein